MSNHYFAVLVGYLVLAMNIVLFFFVLIISKTNNLEQQYHLISEKIAK